MSIDVNVQNDLVIVTESSEDIVVNVSNAAGAPGPAGAPGANGVGVPVGGATGQVLKKFTNTDFDTYWAADASGLTSVGLSMPTAFTVSNTPLTTNGTIAVTGAGTAAQYVRGDGQLATFPSTASGGSSVNYYLNGSVNASVAGYKQLSNTATIGGGTDFTLVGNGLIAQFLTEVGNPNRVEIPGGAWNFEMFFQVSSSGGNQKFYVELLKYNGTTFTSIASSSAVPEEITGGTSIDLYLTSLAVPTTALLVTDRLAIRVYIVDNAAGRTVTLHTEDNTLCEIITTFAGGIAALNGLTANTQYLATGTSGMDFNISSLTDTHTFNLPTASATNRGALSSADWSTFNNKVPSTRTLTINGTTQDLSADRSFTIATANIYTADGTLTGDRIVTSNGNSLTILGGKTIVGSEQIGLILKNSGSPDSVVFSLDNLKNWKLRSLGTGNFDIRNATDLISPIVIASTGNVTFSNNIICSANSITIGSFTIPGIWFNKATPSVSNYSLYAEATATYINGAGGGIWFRNNNANQGVYTAAGRLLLGTTTESTFLLDVNGTARVSGDIRTQNGTTYTDLKANATSGLFLNALIPATFDLYLYMNRNSVYGGSGVSLSSTNTGTGDISSFHNFNVQDFWSRSVNTRDINIATLGGTSGDNKFLTFGLVDASNSDAAIRFRVAGWGNSAIMGVTTRTGRNRNDFDFRVGYGAADLNTGTLAYRINGDSGNFIIGSVGTNVASAILNVDSTTKGFLPPRMTTTEKNAIGTPAAGLQVYDTTLNSISVYDGATWRNDTDTVTTNRQAASYTLALSDRGKLVEMNVATANNLTVPLNSVIAFPIGTKIDLSQYGAGQTTVVATGGVTVRSAGGALKLALQYSGASLVKIATDEWYLFGDITV